MRPVCRRAAMLAAAAALAASAASCGPAEAPEPTDAELMASVEVADAPLLNAEQRALGRETGAVSFSYGGYVYVGAELPPEFYEEA